MDAKLVLAKASNRFDLRHGFELVESGEFDQYYVRLSPGESNV